MQNLYLDISPEVRTALKKRQPVVALESTIIAHGMPFPENLETALLLENAVREQGATPATIALIDGRMKAGLTRGELRFLGETGADIPKVSRRDLPFILSQGQSGATTVASTMIIAAMAGIPVFATGGIGGVHRGAAETMDVSADLQELANTNVAVVCAGAKSILDIGRTLEYLETHGVPVIGFQTDEFPAFYTRRSGFRTDCRLDSPEAIAALLRTKWSLGLNGGVVIANPIPPEHEPKAAPIEAATHQALEEARQKGLTGKAITPFLLAKIKELTGGESLQANIRLAESNAKLAGQIAVALAKTS